ncbi:MAG: filamentous hemagglutinin N-terminal domain-containing protein [Burkholderiales bacterium]|nr:filamentous hemagglutinin N-terminal domain-containing protein [Burkholderiales bacterium]
MKHAKRKVSLGNLTWAMAAVLSTIAADVRAGAATDGTTGAVQSFAGNFTIGQSLGTVKGNNLFHSFKDFSVNSGESATFTTTSNLSNVISRVTGGVASSINGPLKLNAAAGSKPNFFFINPTGVTFGAGATVDVPAGFHVSTANYLKFSDGVFYADPSKTSTFSTAAPEAFGFLGSTRASITLKDGVALSAKVSQPISLVGGDIAINNANVDTRGGDIKIVANGAVGQEIKVSGAVPYTLGNLDILNGGKVSALSNGGQDGGTVVVSAGLTTIDGQSSGKATGIITDAVSGSGNAGNIALFNYGRLNIIDGGQISSSTRANGNAGLIYIDSGSVSIDGKGNSSTGIFSSADSKSAGNAGGIGMAVVGNLSVSNAGAISSSTLSSGDAGKVGIEAGSVSIDGKGKVTGIFTNTSGSGAGGIVDITSKGNLSVLSGGQISSNTYSSGSANKVNVDAGSVTIDHQNSTNSTGIFSAAAIGTGDAGMVFINSRGDTSVLNGGQISSSTWSDGWAGAVGLITAGTLTLSNYGSITSSTKGSGEAGYVLIQSGNVLLNSGGYIASETYTKGNAGYVRVNAANVALSGTASGIYTSANKGASGAAGEVDVTAGNLIILDGAKVTSSTEGIGRGGTINVTADNILIDGGGKNTGIFGTTNGSGTAGDITLKVNNALSISNRGAISSSTTSSGDTGYINIEAARISIDGKNTTTGIFNETRGSGNAQVTNIQTSGNVSILNGGEISSNTYAAGDAGQITVKANNVTVDGQGSTIDTGIFSNANRGSTGEAWSVAINLASDLFIVDGGKISSTTAGSGDGGIVTVNAKNIAIDGKGRRTGIFIDTGGSGNGYYADIQATEDISIQNGGMVSASTSSSGFAGQLRLAANNISINGGDSDFTGLFAQTTGSGSALPIYTKSDDAIIVNAKGALSILSGGRISSSSYKSAGDAGAVSINAGSILLNGEGGKFTGIDSNATGAGYAGNINLKVADNLIVAKGATITSSTYGDGDAGSIKIDATGGSINIDGQGDFTSIATNAYKGSTGQGGNIEIVGARQLSLSGGAQISSSTFSSGDAGSVKISGGSILIDGAGINKRGTGLFSSVGDGGTGNAQSVEVNLTGDLSIVDGGSITSTTFADGNAGTVTVNAANITIDGKANGEIATGMFSSAARGSRGYAGSVNVNARGDLLVASGGLISSTTWGEGDAGKVVAHARNIVIDGKGEYTGIITNAEYTSDAYYAGEIEVTADENLSILNKGQITSNTSAYLADAGSIKIRAGNILVSGGSTISSSAAADSYGQTGTIDILATDNLTLAGKSTISIKNEAEINPGEIRKNQNMVISARNITINNSDITAASTQNVDASDITINYTGRMMIDPSNITTSANKGNGGSITISGSGALVLDHSLITTSVVDAAGGKGGDINISTNQGALVLNSGIIQANTGNTNSTGGNVKIDVGSTITSGNNLIKGGAPIDLKANRDKLTQFGFNVIQAARPDGVNGDIQISSPVIDLSSALASLNAQVLDFGKLGVDLCRVGTESSLTPTGRGGLPQLSNGWIRP